MDDNQEGSSWNEIFQYSLMKVFADDEMIDAVEWTMLEKMALADGVVDTQAPTRSAAAMLACEVTVTGSLVSRRLLVGRLGPLGLCGRPVVLPPDGARRGC